MSAALASATAGPQTGSSDRQYEIAKNSAKLTVTVKLDRDVYFPGEDAQITVRVVNPTPETLEVHAPFDVRTGGLNLMERNGRRRPELPPSEWVFSWAHPVGMYSHQIVVEGEKAPEPPTIWLSPNQPMERMFWASDTGCGQNIPFAGVCTLPGEEGKYRVTYWNAVAQFRIAHPTLERYAGVVLLKPYEHQESDPHMKPTGKVIRIPRRVWAAVLGYQGQHILVINRWNAGAPEIGDASGMFNGTVSRQFGVHRRLATSPEPIKSLQIEADSAENITIVYVLQSGASVLLKLDANRNPIAGR